MSSFTETVGCLFAAAIDGISNAWPILLMVLLVVFIFGGVVLYGFNVSAQEHEFRMACIEQGMTWVEERCEP